MTMVLLFVTSVPQGMVSLSFILGHEAWSVMTEQATDLCRGGPSSWSLVVLGDWSLQANPE